MNTLEFIVEVNASWYPSRLAAYRIKMLSDEEAYKLLKDISEIEGRDALIAFETIITHVSESVRFKFIMLNQPYVQSLFSAIHLEQAGA